MSSFRMFRARGQPGCWYGYAEIDGVTYKIDARHVGERAKKHLEGTIKRHLKADQQSLPLQSTQRVSTGRGSHKAAQVSAPGVTAEGAHPLAGRQPPLVMESNPGTGGALARDQFLRYGSPEAAAKCLMHKGDPCMECGAKRSDYEFDDPLKF